MTSLDDGTAAPRSTFLSGASLATITTEHLALIGFAARLGTKINNDATNSEEAKSVRDEAMLLMSLLMGKKASEILSEEIGGRENHKSRGDSVSTGVKKNKQPRPKDRDIGNFSFTFPVLSLQPDTVDADESEGQGSPTSSPKGGNDDNGVEADSLPPSKLLGRTKSVHDKDDIRESSESMARNVLESFGAALVWRAKTWIKSLAHVLALKEQCNSVTPEKNGASGANDDGADIIHENNEGEDSSHEMDCHVDLDSDLMSSREMQIIEAIVRSSEEVTVVNIITGFRVMPGAIASDEFDEPSSKRLKTISSIDAHEYKVTHKLMFEGTVSMTSNDGGRYKTVKLQAPGVIEGTFSKFRDGASAGDETLKAVSITLDTDALALSLERQSRLVVRRAAEAALMASSGMDFDSTHVHHSVISPRYVLMSPMQPQHYGSDQTIGGQRSFSAPPSVPSQHMDDDATAYHKRISPGLVSTSEDGCSDSSAAPTPKLAPKIEPSSDTPHSPSPSFPALLAVANAELKDEPDLA